MQKNLFVLIKPKWSLQLTANKTWHICKELRSKEENSRRDGWKLENREEKELENRDESITGKKEESKALVTVDGESVDWTTHSENDDNYAFMANNSSGTDTQGSIWARVWVIIDMGGKLVENEVFQSVFRCNESDFENLPLHKRLAKTCEMQAVPPPMTGNYLPSGPDVEIDDSQYTYGPAKTQHELDTRNDLDTPSFANKSKQRRSPSKKEQVFLEDHGKTIKAKEKEANEEAEALTKNLEQENENLVTQAEAAKFPTSGTNIISTVSTTAKASGAVADLHKFGNYVKVSPHFPTSLIVHPSHPSTLTTKEIQHQHTNKKQSQ
ncbi:hypothetical protein Tco_0319471 [Tanacetum coccineum]